MAGHAEPQAFGSARRIGALLVLLSALAVIGSIALWISRGLMAASLCFAAAIAVIYVFVLVLLGLIVPQKPVNKFGVSAEEAEHHRGSASSEPG